MKTHPTFKTSTAKLLNDALYILDRTPNPLDKKECVLYLRDQCNLFLENGKSEDSRLPSLGNAMMISNAETRTVCLRRSIAKDLVKEVENDDRTEQEDQAIEKTQEVPLDMSDEDFGTMHFFVDFLAEIETERLSLKYSQLCLDQNVSPDFKDLYQEFQELIKNKYDSSDPETEDCRTRVSKIVLKRNRSLPVDLPDNTHCGIPDIMKSDDSEIFFNSLSQYSRYERFEYALVNIIKKHINLSSSTGLPEIVKSVKRKVYSFFTANKKVKTVEEIKEWHQKYLDGAESL